MAQAGTGQSVTLHDLVEQAWQRSSAGRSQSAREAETEATRQQSSSWLAGQPVLGLSQRSGRFGGDRGLSESGSQRCNGPLDAGSARRTAHFGGAGKA
ncbi:hypothetical protein LP420_39605 [Massilia sp. B-10]|nr:hypothetical protein LP420_39605 [Massilia sp. B-10]